MDRLSRGRARVGRRRFLARAALAATGVAAAGVALRDARLTAPLGDAPASGGAIVVDADRVVRRKPVGLGAVNIDAHVPGFATSRDGIPFRADLREARVGLVRTVVYPDAHAPDHGLAYFDANVAAILAAGAVPLFLQYIQPGLAYLTAEGMAGGGTVTTNVLALVRRYGALPYNLRTQYWEIGNEPDYDIDYRVGSPAEYTATFNACHDALVAAGLRDQVVLCGPAVAAPYRFPTPFGDNTRIIDAVLADCRRSVDVVTYHDYAAAVATAGELLHLPRELDALEDSARGPADAPSGIVPLLRRMGEIPFARPNVGVGITEYNTNSSQHEIAAGLWGLILTQYYLRNPRGRIAAGFLFDDYGASGYGYYDAAKRKDYAYWALWITGNLRGPLVLRCTTTGSHAAHGHPALLVAATRDARAVYVEVINRGDAVVESTVEVRGARVTGSPTIHAMADGILPNVDRPTGLAPTFVYTFPPLSASIFVFPTANA